MHAIDGMACAKRGSDNRGKLGLNIVGHGSFPTKWGRRWRYRCTVCGGTVSTNTGTAYSGLRCARREFDQVASLRVEGVSISATAQGTGHSRNTIARWLERASTAAKRFNQRMLRDFEIIELQADELCTFDVAPVHWRVHQAGLHCRRLKISQITELNDPFAGVRVSRPNFNALCGRMKL